MSPPGPWKQAWNFRCAHSPALPKSIDAFGFSGPDTPSSAGGPTRRRCSQSRFRRMTPNHRWSGPLKVFSWRAAGASRWIRLRGPLNFTVRRLRKRSADVKRVSVISRPRGVCRLDFALPTGSYADARRGQGRIDRCIVAYAYTYTSRNSHFSCFGVMASLFRVGILGLRVSWALCSLGRSLTTTGPSIPRRTPSANWQRFRRGRNHSMRVYLRDESAAVTPSNNSWRGS